MFSELICNCTYQPTGYPAQIALVTVLPNAGNTTYSATLSGLQFINGTASNLTFAFNEFQSAFGPTTPLFYVGTTALQVSAVALTFTLTPMANPIAGNVAGVLTVTGTPYPAGGASITVSGNIIGTYVIVQ
jgi:hypothetical protein